MTGRQVLPGNPRQILPENFRHSQQLGYEEGVAGV